MAVTHLTSYRNQTATPHEHDSRKGPHDLILGSPNSDIYRGGHLLLDGGQSGVESAGGGWGGGYQRSHLLLDGGEGVGEGLEGAGGGGGRGVPQD